jgi:hypothetical protein
LRVDFSLATVFDVVSVLLTFAVFVLLVAARPRSASALALAAFVLILGLDVAAAAVGDFLPPRGPLQDAVLCVQPALIVARIFASLFFAALYPPEHRTGRLPRLVAGAAVVGFVVLEIAYLADPTIYFSRGVRGEPGPLLFLGLVLQALVFGAALVLFRDARRTAPGPRRSAILLLSFAMALLGPLTDVFQGSSDLATASGRDQLLRLLHADGWGYRVDGVSLLLSLGLFVALVGWSGVQAMRSRCASGGPSSAARSRAPS